MPRVAPGSPSRGGGQSYVTAVRRGETYALLTTGDALYILHDGQRLVQQIDLARDRSRHPAEAGNDAQKEEQTAAICTTVAFDRRTGNIAAAVGADVLLYEEFYELEGDKLRWRYAGRLAIAQTATAAAADSEVAGGAVKALSWGTSGELLVGGDRLTLYSPIGRRAIKGSGKGDVGGSGVDYTRVYNFPLARPLVAASFSPDANLIASFAADDRLVKVWRRLPDRLTDSGARAADFDFVYLPHGRAVTGLRWRTPAREDLTVDNVLYTSSVDGILRVWASDIPHDSHLLTLHAAVPLFDASGSASHRLAVVLDDDLFNEAATAALAELDNDESHITPYLRQAAHRLKAQRTTAPEIVLVLDAAHGRVEAHALTHLGSRTHRPAAQHLVYAEDKHILPQQLRDALGDHAWAAIELQRRAADDARGRLVLTLHTARGVHIMQLDLLKLFAHGEEQCLSPLALIAGHSEAIQTLHSRISSIVSIDADGCRCTWALDKRGHLSLDSLATSDTNGTAIGKQLRSGRLSVAIDGDRRRLEIRYSTARSSTCNSLPEHTYMSEQVITGTACLDDVCARIVVLTEAGALLLQRQLDAAGNPVWPIVWHAPNIGTAASFQHAALTPTGLWLASGRALYVFDEQEIARSASKSSSGGSGGEVYRPGLLIQALALNHFDAVCRILVTLHDRIVALQEGQSLAPDLGIDQDEVFAAAQTTPDGLMAARQHDGLFGGIENDSQDTAKSDETTTEELEVDTAESLASLLAELVLPGLTAEEVALLADLATACADAQQHRTALDAPGLRCYTAVALARRQADRRRSESSVKLLAGKTDRLLSSADVHDALKSTTQEVLLDLLRRPYGGALTWRTARQLGVFEWIRDERTILQLAEDVARSEFLHGGEPDTDVTIAAAASNGSSASTAASITRAAAAGDRDPAAASLWYWALRKHAAVVSCWRVASSHPERAVTLKLLSNNDFAAQRWRTTASKNAYALLGRRRARYAASWFLLAHRPKDAVNVIVDRVGDPALATAIARVWRASAASLAGVPQQPSDAAGGESAILTNGDADADADGDVVLRSLIREKLLPRTLASGDRFAALWARHFTPLPMAAAATAASKMADTVRVLTTDLRSAIQLSADPLSRASEAIVQDEPGRLWSTLLEVVGHDATAAAPVLARLAIGAEPETVLDAFFDYVKSTLEHGRNCPQLVGTIDAQCRNLRQTVKQANEAAAAPASINAAGDTTTDHQTTGLEKSDDAAAAAGTSSAAREQPAAADKASSGEGAQEDGEDSVPAYKERHKARLAAAPQQAFVEPDMAAFDAFDF